MTYEFIEVYINLYAMLQSEKEKTSGTSKIKL